ncbi:MAG: CocE/NonD family hydrolase, partial [Gemmatimonadales bacterium]
MPNHRAFGLAAVIAASMVLGPSVAQSQTVPASTCRFVKIPMRDGVKLNTSICEPVAARDSLPILLTRTPYGIAGDTVVSDDYRFLAADGYVFAYQDIRGRFG